MTRLGVMKHLRLREDAGLVVARKSGREKLHLLKPVPIRLIHDRWIDKYTERRFSALDLSRQSWRASHDRHCADGGHTLVLSDLNALLETGKRSRNEPALHPDA